MLVYLGDGSGGGSERESPMENKKYKEGDNKRSGRGGGGGGYVMLLLLVGCLMSQQHASVSQGRICSDNFTSCHTEIEVADQTFYLTQSPYTDTRLTSPSADPTTPGAWQGSHWSANFWVTGMTRPRKNPGASGIWTRGSSTLEADALTTRPTRRSVSQDCSGTRQVG